MCLIYFYAFLFISLMPLLSFPQGYGEEGLYSEQEGIGSAPMFGPGIVGKKVKIELNC